MKKTVLIFGISSFVGSNLAQLLSEEYRIVGTYNSTPVDIPGITCVPCDVLNKDYVTKIVAIFKPDFTLYAAGMSSLNECQVSPKKADALNSAGAVNCSNASERYGSKFIYLSSCFVLGGEDVVYREADTPFPNSVYGNSLSSTEFYIQRSCLNYLILRCCPLYGRSFNPAHINWFEAVQMAFAKNEPLAADDSVKTGFLDIMILGKILKNLLNLGVTNRLLQVSSMDTISRFEFAKVYAKVFGKDPGIIQVKSGNFPIDHGNRPAPKGVSKDLFYRMETANLETLLGTVMPTVEQSLQLTQKRFSSKL